MTGAVIQTETRIKDIEKLLEEKLLPAIGGAPLNVASAAMLMAIVASMRPDISSEDLLSIVTDAAAHIVMQVALLDATVAN